MKYYDEILERIAQRVQQKDHLSESGYKELMANVAERPRDFVTCPEDASYLCFAEGLDLYYRLLGVMLEDPTTAVEIPEEQMHLIETSDTMLRQAYSMALAIYPDNLDARYLSLMHTGSIFGIENLLEMKRLLDKHIDMLTPSPSVYTRPYQRLHASYIQALVQNGSYKLAIEEGLTALSYDESDPFGVRHSLSLCYARLEDVRGFEELEERFGRTSNCWSYLARIILMYRVNNLTAAKRAITGYTKLVPGAAHLILSGLHLFPISKAIARPQISTCTFNEANIATREAFEIIEDTPNFREWANSIDQVRKLAEEYEKSLGI